ncbi:hypothetical protein SDRG_16473 [Saprolegnia diclina VS20]|uniref:Uncharacterized protein n=1 Tax=Saprolegnia diclina (strain VS20) TaxID=1156394 RepID=T0R831_SAPDV|nr:hypothetical protein SDRG_16473 [Saprolegnia diclina VS20]EQC25652.1 hypothetical protein SDRG_16473 [Saprolegnia diclina VS20]|eukprot:XP_008620909.1 hypothetical protein SDRG_16473 [Saprolegnia diclina VS20]
MLEVIVAIAHFRISIDMDSSATRIRPDPTHRSATGHCLGCGSRTRHHDHCPHHPKRRGSSAADQGQQLMLPHLPRLEPAVVAADAGPGPDDYNCDAVHEGDDEGDEPVGFNRSDLKAHLDEHWRRVSATLPRMYGTRVAQSATLDKTKWSNDSFMLPNALLKAGDATMFDFLFSNMQVFVLCPFLFYGEAMREFELTCVACGEQGCHLNGWNSSWQVVVGLESVALGKVRSFKQVIAMALINDLAVVQYKTFTWPVDKFTFKDAEHLKAYGTKAVPKAIQAAHKAKSCGGRRSSILTLRLALKLLQRQLRQHQLLQRQLQHQHLRRQQLQHQQLRHQELLHQQLMHQQLLHQQHKCGQP